MVGVPSEVLLMLAHLMPPSKRIACHVLGRDMVADSWCTGHPAPQWLADPDSTNHFAFTMRA
jgi:hypothetical protein